MTKTQTLSCRLVAIVASIVTLCSGKVSGVEVKIDEILSKHHADKGIEANPPVGDEVFLRRIYLDVIGRIPTKEEAVAFLEATDPGKRGRLIDQLIGSDAHVHRAYAMWADMLRVRSRMPGVDGVVGLAYELYLKDSLRENKPYDQIVRELVTAEGDLWDNGATGFYLRDRGMPLDHLATTLQVFLGTQMVCAQCHDHPFDRWTQMEYFEMAAFTSGMDSRYGGGAMDVIQGAARDRMRGLSRNQQRDLRSIFGEMSRPLRNASVRETGRLPRLPRDYAYSDGKPGDEVRPVAMFGPEVEVPEGGSRIAAFADWMTSPDNPRFAGVMANRLWKQAMGYGLVEPIDDFRDDTVASVPELFEHLAELFVALDYDMRAFLAEIYKTEIYQREVSGEEVPMGSHYAFPGPVLRRMTAEQAWDSLVTLAVADPDVGDPAREALARAQLRARSEMADSLKGAEIDEVLAFAGEMVEKQERNRRRAISLAAQAQAARQAGDEGEARRLGREASSIQNSLRSEILEWVYGDLARRNLGQDVAERERRERRRGELGEVMNFLEEMGEVEGDSERRRRDLARSAEGYVRTAERLVRAADIDSPAPRGHFLLEFGQSDRDLIDNSSPDAAVSQALYLLNGPTHDLLSNRFSRLNRSVMVEESAEGKIEALYLTLLSRRPAEEETRVMAEVLEERGDKAYGDILAALLNSRQFFFIQ